MTFSEGNLLPLASNTYAHLEQLLEILMEVRIVIDFKFRYRRGCFLNVPAAEHSSAAGHAYSLLKNVSALVQAASSAEMRIHRPRKSLSSLTESTTLRGTISWYPLAALA